MIDAIQKHRKTHPLKVSEVLLDGWEDPFYVREMDAEAMAAFFAINRTNDGDGTTFSVTNAANVIVLHLCDKNGRLLCKPDDREKAAQDLQSLRFQEVTQLATAALTVSGLTKTELEEAGGNSTASP